MDLNQERQAHVDRLARELGCRVVQQPRMPGMMFVEKGYIEGPTIESQIHYLTLLHELGHFAHGHTQGRPPHTNLRYYFEHGVLRCEAEAWRWALDACSELLEAASRFFMWDDCLGSYYQGAVWAGDRPSTLANGDRAYVTFVYDKPDAYFMAVMRDIQGSLTGFRVRGPELRPHRVVVQLIPRETGEAPLRLLWY